MNKEVTEQHLTCDKEYYNKNDIYSYDGSRVVQEIHTDIITDALVNYYKWLYSDTPNITINRHTIMKELAVKHRDELANQQKENNK